MQYRKKQVPMKYRKQMNMLTGKATGSGMFNIKIHAMSNG